MTIFLHSADQGNTDPRYQKQYIKNDLESPSDYIKSIIIDNYDSIIDFNKFILKGEQRYRPLRWDIRFYGRWKVTKKFLSLFNMQNGLKMLNDIEDYYIKKLYGYELLQSWFESTDIVIKEKTTSYSSLTKTEKKKYYNYVELGGMIQLIKKLELTYKCDGLSTAFGKLYLNGENKNPQNLDQFVEYRNIYKRISEWLIKKADRKTYFDKDFYDVFRLKVRSLFGMADTGKLKLNDNKKVVRNKFLSLREFIDDRSLWTTTGATIEKKKNRIINSIGDFDYTIKYNKLEYSLNLSTDELYDQCLYYIKSKPNAYHKPVVKNESNNIRIIAIGDTINYILMAYLSYIFEGSLSVDNMGLFAYLSESDQNEAWLKMMNDCSGVFDIIHLALDYSGWDENIDDDMIAIVIDELTDWLLFMAPDSRNARTQLFREVCYYFKDFRSRCFIYDVLSLNGLFSGWRWTTLINSVCNKCLNEMVIDRFKTVTGHIFSIRFLYVLGDDVILSTFNIKEDVELYMSIINEMGFKLNTKKSKYSKKNGEFLKYYYSNRGIGGNIYRAIRSILYSVEDEEKYTDMQLLRPNLWSIFLSRMKYNLFEENYKMDIETIIEDVYYSFNCRISKLNVKRWLNTPEVYGGAGLFENKIDYWFSIKEEKLELIDKTKFLSQYEWKYLSQNEKYVNNKKKWNKFSLLNSLQSSLVSEQTRMNKLNNLKLRNGEKIFDCKSNTLGINVTTIMKEYSTLITSNVGNYEHTYRTWNTHYTYNDYLVAKNNFEEKKITDLGNDEDTYVDESTILKIKTLRNMRLSKNLINELLANNSLFPALPKRCTIQFGEVLNRMVWHVVSTLYIINYLGNKIYNLEQYKNYIFRLSNNIMSSDYENRTKAFTWTTCD